VILYVVAYFQPMWGFYIYSPQYPQGLILSIRLNELVGDIQEINILNHYIGMAHLEQAAQLERAMTVYGLCGISLVTILLVFLPGRRYARFFALPAFAFPIAFVAIQYYWMYHFGHHLSPDAPVDIAPFTPTLLGIGQIGNFRTLGMPGAGFYLIVGSAIAVAAAFWLRSRICHRCPMADNCKVVCPKLFVGKDSQ
jgi:hypothetical protein